MTTAYKFCPHCGAALIVGPVSGHVREHCPACGFIAFHNPAPVGLAVIMHEGKVALVRRALPPLKGYWAPPGGHIELGESAPEATVREAKEECGLDIALDRLIGVYSQADVRTIIIAYLAHSIGGAPTAGDDAVEVGLFDEWPPQPPPDPAWATATDHWFYGVLRELGAAVG